MTRRLIEIAAFCAALLIAALAVHAWLASRDDQQRLAATLTAQKQLIDSANSDERARQASLAQALAQIEKLKRTTHSPEQIVAALRKDLSLPQPITLMRANASTANSEQGTAASPNSLPTNPTAPSLGSVVPGEDVWRDTDHQVSSPAPCTTASDCSAQIPAADLAPLYNYVQDCRACQLQLAAAQQNSADDAAKISALTRERDAAITAANGGSFLRRLRRNAIWLAVGAAAGYAAARH